MIDEEALIQEFDLKPFGSLGWLRGRDMVCPVCDDWVKFGIRISSKGAVCNCMKGHYSMPVEAYLKEIGRTDLILEKGSFSINRKLKSIRERREEVSNNSEEELEEVKPPRKYKRVFDEEYLNKRSFNKYHYDLFEPGTLRRGGVKYLIFLLRQEEKIVAWLGRSTREKEWHKKNLRDFKDKKTDDLVLRYINASGVDFTKILGGVDEIEEETHTVILVEGIFDKVNVDTVLKLNEDPRIKCCFTFGNKVSNEQIDLLKKKRGLKSIILMYDYGTVRESSSHSLKLSKHFETYVCFPPNSDVDPGDVDKRTLLKMIVKKVNAIHFFTQRTFAKISQEKSLE